MRRICFSKVSFNDNHPFKHRLKEKLKFKFFLDEINFQNLPEFFHPTLLTLSNIYNLYTKEGRFYNVFCLGCEEWCAQLSNISNMYYINQGSRTCISTYTGLNIPFCVWANSAVGLLGWNFLLFCLNMVKIQLYLCG